MNETTKPVNTATLRLETVEAGLRFGATTGTGTSITMDSGPGATAPTPMDLLLVAIAGCMAMDVTSILRKQRQAVTGYEIAIAGERRTEHPKAYTKVEIVHRVGGHEVSLKAVEEAVELSHAKYCSVQHSIHPGIAVTNRCEVIPA